MPSVTLSDVTRAYGRQDVLRGVSMQIERGEFAVLLGPSGCGKSTLLAAIAGLDELQGGRVLFDGQDVTDREPAERGIGMVFQSYALYPTMSVRRNLSFGLSVARTPRAEVERRVAWAAGLLQIEPLLDRRPAQLSGGQRQRVAIGRALVRQSDLFLFDEPLSNLDAKLRTEMRVEIKSLHQRLGATFIYVTHDQVEAMTLATRIAVMNGGRIEQFASPDEIYARPATLFVADFVGSPPMNLLHGRLRIGAEGPAVDLGEERVSVAAYPFQAPPEEDRRVVLGVRPEAIGVNRPDAPARLELPLAITETLGADALLWFDREGGRVCARVPPAEARGVAGTAQLSFEPAEASLFCAETERRL